jgi:hypothetical protein
MVLADQHAQLGELDAIVMLLMVSLAGTATAPCSASTGRWLSGCWTGPPAR